MSCARQDKRLVRGENKTWRVTLVDSDGAAVDLTGARAWCTVKEDIDDVSYVIRKDSDVGPTEIELKTPLADGILDIYFVPADSASLNITPHVYDILVELATGKRYYVVKPSKLYLERGVTEL